jgi:hypothetical protein
MDLIGRLTIYSPPPSSSPPTSHAEFVDNISFDAQSGVPEPATWITWALLAPAAAAQASLLARRRAAA